MDILALVKSAFALFAIVDPVGVIPIFLLATQGYTLTQSRAAARIAALTVLGVLTLCETHRVAHVRMDHHVVEREQRVVARQGLGVEHVETGPGDAPLRERRQHRCEDHQLRHQQAGPSLRLRQQVRQTQGRQGQPSAGIVDSQSVKSSECSDERGYDAGKKINGRKRHLLVDTLGLVLLVMVLPANIQDRDGARQLLEKHFGRRTRRRVKHLWADAGYAGTLIAWALQMWRCTVEIVKRTDAHTFKVLPRRWVVERTFGWLNRYRRLSRDYERQAQTGETMVYLAMIRLMVARLATDS